VVRKSKCRKKKSGIRKGLRYRDEKEGKVQEKPFEKKKGRGESLASGATLGNRTTARDASKNSKQSLSARRGARTVFPDEVGCCPAAGRELSNARLLGKI